MQYYDSSGNLITNKTDGAWYYNQQGKLLPVPNMLASKEDIFDYLESCIKASYPDISLKEITELWNEYMNHVKEIIKEFKILSNEEAEKKVFYKVRVYNNAIATLSRLNFPIVSGRQAQKLYGIGEKLGEKIDQIIESGKLERVKKMEEQNPEEFAKREEKNRVLKLFQSIYGIGPVTAETWYAQGYRTLDEIAKYEWKHLSRAGRKTLKWHKYLSQPIPRSAIDYQKEFWEATLYSMDIKAKIEIVGSYRRGAKFSNDIDILIGASKREFMDKFVDRLKEDHDVVYILQRKEEKITTLSQMFKGPKLVKVDFFFSTLKNWGVALLAWTGPGSFEQRLRARAKRKGFKLSHINLTNRKTGKIIPTPTEKSVFKALDMEYIPPGERY